MSKNKHISAVNEVGQSIWYDNLSRDVLRSGELASLIDSGVSGLTSNPTIFKKAIADTTNYDADIQVLARKGLSTDDICEDLMIRDVGNAADLLIDIYKKTNGQDGYASVEVSPSLACNTQATVEAAKRIWWKLNRPNIMIKVPGTKEGLPAVQTLLHCGINVNITLLFSVEHYEKVVEAYISGLESRASRGDEIKHVTSVASFFVSRVDAICEKKFEDLVKAGKAKETDRNVFFGKVGIANCRVTYAKFEELFSSDRFMKLKKLGAKVQRPLWASTGTKNPALKPVLYVEELAGKDTVNTLPPATLKALLADATIEGRLHTDLGKSRELIATVNKLGLPFDELMDELQDDGVKLFSESYAELVESIRQKRKAFARALAA